MYAGHAQGGVGFPGHAQVPGGIHHVACLIGDGLGKAGDVPQQAHPGAKLPVGPLRGVSQLGFVIFAGVSVHPQEIAVAGVVHVHQSGAQHVLVFPRVAVKHRQAVPIAAEAQEGQAQIHAIFRFRIQEGEAFHIGAVGEIFRDVVPACRGERHIHRKGGGAIGGNRDPAAVGVGHVHLAAGQPLLGAGRVAQAVFLHHSLHQNGGVQAVSFGGIGQVVHSDGIAVVAGGIGTHLSFGPVAVLYRQICLGHNGIVHIGHTGALTAHRKIGSGSVVQGRHSRGHEQAVGQLAQLVGSQVGVSLLKILAEHRSLTGHVGGGHGGAAHGGIAAADDRGINFPAGGGNFRLDGQIRRRADAAEGTDLIAVGVIRLAIVTGGEGDGFFRSVQHSLGVSLGDGDHRDGMGLEGSVVQPLVGIVVNDDGDGANRCGVGCLYIKIQVTPGHQGNFAGEIQAGKILLRAQAGNGYILHGLPFQGLQNVGLDLGVIIHRVIVGNGLIPQGKVIPEIAGVVHAGHAHGRREG